MAYSAVNKLNPLKHQYERARKLELEKARLIGALAPLAHWQFDFKSKEDIEKFNQLRSYALKILRSVEEQ